MIPNSLSNTSALGMVNFGLNYFIGPMPEDLGELLDLQRMNFQGNHPICPYIELWRHGYKVESTNGSIPSGIENLLNLSVIPMTSNYLSGPIPDTIGRLRKLHYLELDMNKFTELPSSIGNSTELNHLLLGINNIRGSIPSSLGNCQNLIELDLSHNNLYGSIPLEILNLSSISISFNLGYNSLTDSLPSEVGSMKNPREFDVSNNRL
ncbi:probable leucine-rich repeat receptor-like protein kinase At1g35710 [Rhododendron vialii]|uniref:probable leucine-rich repeat receptor-like protein kinase At1g35710 n=1 Tax=Rhododendron vialii TaxID=182163 RepID=UPI00265E6901|nr:probable leucine-rich repeat receptor-like protein kinase At1g35710 [Rhododendron vialii]